MAEEKKHFADALERLPTHVHFKENSALHIALPDRQHYSKHENYNLSFCNNIERTQFMAFGGAGASAAAAAAACVVKYYYYFGSNNVVRVGVCCFAKNVCST